MAFKGQTCLLILLRYDVVEMLQRAPITVRLESFEGPLDLLLHLIQIHEFDISRVSLAQVTDQYLAYVYLMQELNFDTASEFLVMAATLLHWKSKALLPPDPSLAGLSADGEELGLTQEQLIRQLMEHKRFLEAGEELNRLPKLGEDFFIRLNPRPPIERVWKEMNITELALRFQDTMVRAKKRKQILKKETVSLTDKIHEFAARLAPGVLTEITRLLSAVPTRPEVVVTFLATLELSRLKKMRLHQEEAYSTLYVELLESIENLDTSLLNGFDSAENPAKEADLEKPTPEASTHELSTPII